MNKPFKSKKEKVPRMTEEQYAEYVSSLKDEEPIAAYADLCSGKHSTSHIDAERDEPKG